MVVAGVVFVLFALMMVNAAGGLDLFKDAWATRAAEAEASRMLAQAEALEARRALLAEFPLVVASLKDSVLVAFFSVCNSVLLFTVVVMVVWIKTRGLST